MNIGASLIAITATISRSTSATSRTLSGTPFQVASIR
jgi:hypothetical protein